MECKCKCYYIHARANTIEIKNHLIYECISQQFGKEILADDKNDLKYDKVKGELEKASGANYGTGK